jgi:hypothetical protein
MIPFSPSASTTDGLRSRICTLGFTLKQILKSRFPFYNELAVEYRAGRLECLQPAVPVYINGKAVQGLDTNHRSLPLDVTGEAEVYIYAYSGSCKNLLLNARINKINKEIEKLYYDLLVPFEVLVLPTRTARSMRILSATF